MIDSIHIRLSKQYCTAKQLLKLESVITNVKYFHNSRFAEAFKTGNFKNFKITIDVNNICINGSIPKYLYGNNIRTPTHGEVIQALQDLKQRLGINIFWGEIARIDIAETIPVAERPIKYFTSLLETPGYERISSEKKTHGVRYQRKPICLAFYNKTPEIVKHPEIYRYYQNNQLLRIELRIMKNVRRTLFNKLKKITVAHLISKNIYGILCKHWVNNFDSIIKKREIIEPYISDWKDFRDYLLAKHICNEKYQFVIDELMTIAIDNHLCTRIITNIKKHLHELNKSNLISTPNKYIKELEDKIAGTDTYRMGSH